MPDTREIDAWIRRNDAAREADRAADRAKSMEERLEEAAHVSRIATELRDNMHPAADRSQR